MRTETPEDLAGGGFKELPTGVPDMGMDEDLAHGREVPREVSG